jgi:hypothetical protein
MAMHITSSNSKRENVAAAGLQALVHVKRTRWGPTVAASLLGYKVATTKADKGHA